jgi:transcriptional regulator with XRE-family HTH domain
MASPKLEHYLRTCRKRSGLSQSEVAYLLGARSKNQVSRYERRSHATPLRAALLFEALYGAPVSEMFAGVYESVRKELKRRARELAREFQAQDGKRNRRVRTQKLQWLVEHCGNPNRDR